MINIQVTYLLSDHEGEKQFLSLALLFSPQLEANFRRSRVDKNKQKTDLLFKVR